MVGPLRRVFAAVPLPTEVRLALVDRLSGVDIPGKVASPENWHITLRFLGQVDEVTYERFLGSLSSADLGSRFKVSLGGLGAFPNAGRATVMWIGLERGSSELERLARTAEESAQNAGLTPEDRPFHAHLSLSRIRPPENVRGTIEAIESVDIGWRCESVLVYESRQGSGGIRYEPLETIPLSR